MNSELKRELQELALKIRIGALEAIQSLGSGHVGGAMSIADTLAVLYGGEMNIKVDDPKWEARDKFVCSKGHAGPAVYATLAVKGFFPYEELKTLNRPGTNLPSHCDKNKTIGVDMTTGSLGQGVSLAVGMALGEKLKGSDSRVFLMVGDGEMNEGQVWEGAMFASARKLDNLILFLDWNKKQLDGTVKEILDTGDIAKKFDAFGFDTQLVKGNDVEAIYEAIQAAKGVSGKPHAIVLDNIKGSGVKDVEEKVANHSIPVSKEDGDKWIAELKAQIEALAK